LKADRRSVGRQEWAGRQSRTYTQYVPQTEIPMTLPRKVFGVQMDNVLYLLKNIQRDIEQIYVPLRALEDAVGSSRFDAIKPYVAEIDEIVEATSRTQPFLFDWMLVMAVAFAESYLEGALQLLAAADPQIMSMREEVLRGVDVLSIDAASYEDRWNALLATMRKRWAT
jgi:hypothetical protein